MAVGIRGAAVLAQNHIGAEGPPVPFVVELVVAVRGMEPIHCMDSVGAAQLRAAMVVEIQPWMPFPRDRSSLPSLPFVAAVETGEEHQRW